MSNAAELLLVVPTRRTRPTRAGRTKSRGIQAVNLICSTREGNRRVVTGVFSSLLFPIGSFVKPRKRIRGFSRGHLCRERLRKLAFEASRFRFISHLGETVGTHFSGINNVHTINSTCICWIHLFSMDKNRQVNKEVRGKLNCHTRSCLKRGINAICFPRDYVIVSSIE